MYYRNLKLWDFFESVRNRELTDLEISNYIEEITHSFKSDKVKMFLTELNIYTFIFKETQDSQISIEKVKDKLKKLELSGKDIQKYCVRLPDVKYINHSSKDRYIIEKELLFYPNELEPLYYIEKDLQTKLDEIKDLSANNVPINPHPRIFKTLSDFELFDYLKDTVKNDLADYSYIFRKMHSENFIFEGIKESEFRSWLTETYGIPPLDKLKLIDYCKTHKKDIIFSTAKRIFKSN